MNSQRSSGQYVAAANVEMFNENVHQEEDDSRMGGGTINETAYTSQNAGKTTASPNLSGGVQGNGLTPNLQQYSHKLHSPNYVKSQPGLTQDSQHRIILNGT